MTLAAVFTSRFRAVGTGSFRVALRRAACTILAAISFDAFLTAAFAVTVVKRSLALESISEEIQKTCDQYDRENLLLIHFSEFRIVLENSTFS